MFQYQNAPFDTYSETYPGVSSLAQFVLHSPSNISITADRTFQEITVVDSGTPSVISVAKPKRNKEWKGVREASVKRE